MGFREVLSGRLMPTALAFAACALTLTQAAVAQGLDAETMRTLCGACHNDKFAASAANPHSALESAQWREHAGVDVSCEACHGDVEDHVLAGSDINGVFAFRDEPAAEQAGRCLNCHQGAHPGYARSPHARAGMACLDCHSQHGETVPGSPLLRVTPTAFPESGLRAESAVCFNCHGEIFTQFSSNERHRLFEGTIDCVSCHNPHEPVTRRLLGGFKQTMCESCHADKAGPFVFEHRASRVESCTACHSPHGSTNRHLLTHQRVGELCFSCHAETPQFHLGFSPFGPPRFGLDTQCTNCHSAIHGSNFHEFFLR